MPKIMKKIPLPTKIIITEDKEDKNKAIITIEPCYPGYGVTIGNALRRVLLSSLLGAAVIAFKIKGVQHEFSTVPGIKEDLVEIMLNLKQIRLKVFSEEPVELSLNIKGEKKVTAQDIERNSDVEIINPNLTICHLTDKNASLEMKIWVAQGLGYVTVEEQKDAKPEIGVIQVDAFYSPIKKVGFKKENVRVGERTDYDKLTLDIETDGTITPKEAVEKVAAILVEQFSFIASGGEVGEVEEQEIEQENKNEEKQEEAGDKTDIKSEKVGHNEKETTKKLEEERPKKKRGRPKKS